MPLKRTVFTVYLNDPEAPEGYTEHRVEVMGGDQLRAEMEGRTFGIDHRAAIHQTYLWAWAALVRNKLYEDTFSAFREVVIKVDDDGTEDVDPTPPAIGAGLPSDSPSPTPAPGSTTG